MKRPHMPTEPNASELALRHPATRMAGKGIVMGINNMIDELFKMGLGDLTDDVVEHIQKKHEAREQNNG